MASSTPFDGTNWLTTAPDQDQPHGNDYQEHQATRKSVEFVSNKEHDTIANDPSAADGGGEHKKGSAKIYHANFSTASAGDNLPTLRPDGVTALDVSDAGRRAYDTDATFGGKFYRWSGSAWQVDQLTVNNETDLSSKSWFLDQDDMLDDDATKVASQQSIKAFVIETIESQTAYSAYTLTDSDNNAMMKDHSYLAQTDGFVAVRGSVGSNQSLFGYVSTSANPVSTGAIVQGITASTTETYSLFFAVAKDEFFEIVTSDGSLDPGIRWKSKGALSKPIDQD